MKNWTLLWMIFSLGAASAFGFTDITIHDNDAGETAGWDGSQEDDEVVPGNPIGQEWDLEALVLADDGTLWLIGGFDFKDGYGGWLPGDVFVSTDGTVNYGQTTIGEPGSDTGFEAIVPNSLYDYEYALVPDIGAGTYDVYGLTDNDLLAVFFGGNNEGANPWRLDLDSAGAADSSGSLLFYDYGSAELNTLLGQLSGAGITFSDGIAADLSGPSDARYALGLQGFTTAVGGGDFVVHYSYQCGNDQIMGRVPDGGATLLLCGMSLLGLTAIRRRAPEALS